ncbi:MAG: hypothetical protein AAGG48_01695 [Planctomycetota bacterium]
MTCQEIANRLATFNPDLTQIDIARLTLMVLVQSEDPESLRDDDVLREAWQSAAFRLESVSDQHAAVANELDAMCNEVPIQFNSDQLWVLLRAVKVQSQILELYTDQPVLA